MQIVLPEAKAYLPGAGFCIYCRRRAPEVPRLTREHIIPFGLRGQVILHQASCDDCARIINSEIETPCLGHMVAARTSLKLNKPARRPEKLKYGRWTGPRNEMPQNMSEVDFEFVDIDPEDMPLRLILPIFGAPGIIANEPLNETFLVYGMQFYNDSKRLPQAPDGQSEGQFEQFNPNKFCRMIAKIAHGAAIAELGGSAFLPFLPDVILGKSRNISHFVGSNLRRPKWETAKHKITLSLRQNYIIADIQLFANLGYRPYRAVAGEAGPDFSKWHLSSYSKLSRQAV